MICNIDATSFSKYIIMSFFFEQPTPSQSSQNQNTAFFQNGQTPKASIFDQHAQSQSQIAYDLFNIQSNEVEEKQKSIISKLDILDRIREEETFDHISTPFPPQKHSNFQVESQQSKMTFGNKLSNPLRQSKVQYLKEQKVKEREEAPKQPRNKLRLHEPLSNFSFFRTQQNSNTRLEEPQSMPLKFEEPKKPSKKKFFDTTSSKSSSISIDFDQLKQRQQQQQPQQQKTPVVSKMQSFKLLMQDKKVSKIEAKPQPFKLADKIKQKVQQQKNNNKQAPPVKQKKFQFNLRRSRVTQENKTPQQPQKSFFSKINLVNNSSSHGSATISNQNAVPMPMPMPIPPIENSSQQNILKSDVKRVSEGNNLFKSRTKDINQKPLLLSRIKNKQPQKVPSIAKNLQDESNANKLSKSSKSKKAEEQRKTFVVNDKYESLAQTFDKDSSISVDSRSQTSSKGKRESIGLKQQLKKLTSRPTEKVQLKSIAFNKNFKLKQSKPVQEKPTQSLKMQLKNMVKQNQGSVIVQAEQSKTTVEKNYLLPVKTSRNSQFSHFMLTLIELQQESQSLRQRTIQSRNSYRQLAILNDDINRRIDESLNRRK